MDKLFDVAAVVAKKLDLNEEMQAAFVLKKLEQIIERQWGKKGVDNLKPQKIVFNQVYLKARNAAWSQEFFLQKHRILHELNQEGIKRILEIKISL